MLGGRWSSFTRRRGTGSYTGAPARPPGCPIAPACALPADHAASGRTAPHETEPHRAAPPHTAIVLVHGYLCLCPSLYWLGLRPLRRALAALGADMLASRQRRTGSLPERGEDLARFLAGLPHARIVLVGHSMGGLDARWVAARADPERRIRHVVTVATPHRGTPIAERILRDPGRTAWLFRFVDRGALKDLTPEGAARLAGQMPDRPDVTYLSLAGTVGPAWLPSPLRRLAEALAEATAGDDAAAGAGTDRVWTGGNGLDPTGADRSGPGPAAADGAVPGVGVLAGVGPGPGDAPRPDDGPDPGDGPHLDDGPNLNDGIVPLASARWGRACFRFPTDHMGLVGNAFLTPTPRLVAGGLASLAALRALLTRIAAGARLPDAAAG